MDSMMQMSPAMMFGVAAFWGLGIAIGLALLAGTFYLIWRFIRAIEKRNEKL
ncbi:hypothetical protein EFBL_3347 [Effusibacillus lacus]|uniref:Uncharacterized protein n=2 Tax=Effusibacillus lacus TaxID=1348429 RepID=A0A292YKL8_9BACL|nr:hypothetical protein EFBL_3347 [Effusibacillus lacus]